MNKLSSNAMLLVGVVVLALGPLLALQGRKFGATDGNNSTTIQEIQPSYKPWFEPVIKDSGPEVQTFLFAAQAGIGAGITGYILGFYKGRSQRKAKGEKQ
jgi:cobalt/nickel transport protein